MKLKIAHPEILSWCAYNHICEIATEKPVIAPFTCDALVVLGGNILKRGEHYITTPYEKGTKKSFGAQGRVIAAAFLYHLGVTDCLILSTGKTDPDDRNAPSEAAVMKAELLAYDVPEGVMHMEERSKTTQENARELVKLFRQEPFREKRTIGLITSSWHIRRVHAFLQSEGFHTAGRKIKYISSDTVMSRYLPQFRNDIHLIYRGVDMRKRIQDELNGYIALKNGTYCSRQLGEILEVVRG